MLVYLVVMLLYSFGLKRVALIDVFAISAGFILRAVAGAVVIGFAHIVVAVYMHRSCERCSSCSPRDEASWPSRAIRPESSEGF